MGGAKVVYEHAKGLARRGHNVSVVGPERTGGTASARILQTAVWFRDRLHGVSKSPYYKAEGVESLVVPESNSVHIPDADAIVATGVQTARWVNDLPSQKGRKFYFIQGYEAFADASVEETWRLPLSKFTCASWLRDKIVEAGEEVLGVIPNAIDATEFYVTNLPRERDERIVAMYHRHPVKGPDVLIDALQQIKEVRPNIQADIFSARPPSHKLPSWVDVHIRPSSIELRSIYNRAAIVWSTSQSEGWGLVTMEGAACGCAVVATATEGIKEYLNDGESVRLVAVDDSHELARATEALLNDAEERNRLAVAGQEAVRAFSWEESTARLERILML